MRIKPFLEKDRISVLNLLTMVDLPTQDLTLEKLQGFLVARAEDGTIAGTIGIEPFKEKGLLRSFAVHKKFQGKGLGSTLLKAFEKAARDKGIDGLYLLTTTARDYFLRFGYERIERAMVPESIQKTREFQDICPGSAVCLLKSF